MIHAIKTEAHAPFGDPMAEAVQTCVHCGFCLASCPTYEEFGEEMDSPRGRILLMKHVLEGQLPAAEAQVHLDRCLGCLSCEPACPSGVSYRDLISPFRATMESRGEFQRPAAARFRRWVASQTIPYPTRFRLALVGAKVGKAVEPLVPGFLKPMLALAPDVVPPKAVLPAVTPAQGMRRARVALLTGCAQQVLDPDINVATLAVLARNGVEVVIPSRQGCCGGLAWHTGDLKTARELARRNLDAFPADVDAIITNAAGCGSTMHEYDLVLRGTSDEERAKAFGKRVLDVSVFLAQLGLRERPAGPGPQRVAYHDACHLANAQGVRAEPRDLLRAIAGLELLELANQHLCCGSAGTYNMDQPETAASLGEKKARAIMATGATIVATGNIGCLTQLKVHLKKLGSPIRVRHTIQVVRDAYLA
ncbi:glycolate oxidase subunit GlcF [Opitutus sp. ER46]|uniref:glycolate oxidase subunit GlcF n=1 Tax=Opitutus sp. ER46 TaxID=2161864 RepID=UPI000D304B1C|nr:glycolate oxidase subunit GlcF [Opitutus sp. ER46]PTX95644.1 glycolate oxidase iron-sulfur subunit [Opitutus sp. ER46]